MRTLARCGCAAALLACALGGVQARADIVTINFSGTVDFAFATFTLPGGDILPGDPISGSLTYDTFAADQAPGDPSTGVYALTGFSMTIGSNSFTLSAAPPSPTLTIENEVGGVDAMTADLLANDGVRDITTSLRFEDPSGTVLSSDALPLSFPAFGPGTLFMEFIGPEGELFLEGTVFGPPVIPAPDAGLLAALGVVSVLAARRRL